MLTDEELTTRLEAALRDSVPEMTYAGPVPRVRRRGGLAATSVLAAATALALTPAALERGQSPSPQAVPSARPGAHHSAPPGHTVIHTLNFAGLHLTYAEVDGLPGPLYMFIGPDVSLPADAEKVDLDTAGDVEVWFVDDPASGEPQVYVRQPDSSMLFGLYGQGWSRQQLITLLEHPEAAQRGQN
jgi:hypothetical protein